MSQEVRHSGLIDQLLLMAPSAQLLMLLILSSGRQM